MRKIVKQKPPVNVSPPGQIVRSLAQAETNYLAGLPTAQNPSRYARSEFNCMHKRALRDVHYAEQHHLCVFCERYVVDGPHKSPRIDHWRPLSLNLSEVFKWENLHLSCATYDTCDSRKHESPLKAKPTDPDLPYPSQFIYEDILGFTSGGRIYVRNDVPIAAAIRSGLELAIEDQVVGGVKKKSILNLNSPALREARAAAIEEEEESLLAEYGEVSPTPTQRQSYATSLLAASQRSEYISIRIATILGTLGVGR